MEPLSFVQREWNDKIAEKLKDTIWNIGWLLLKLHVIFCLVLKRISCRLWGLVSPQVGSYHFALPWT